MANTNVSLFYRPEGYSVGGLRFDLITGESHTMSNTVTSHKLESGAEITDHIKNDLRPGSISGIVTNHSIQTFGTFLDTPLGGKLPNRALTAYEAFLALYRQRSLVTVVSQCEVYEDVALLDVTVTKESAGDVLEFFVNFREVTTADLQQIDIEASVNPLDMATDTDRQAAPLSDQGLQVGS